MGKKLSPALKAWQTRRKNHAKRVKAAIKAWATRHAIAKLAK